MHDLYGPGFFEEVERTARTSALRVVPVALRTLRPRHVIDVGCGEGVWAAAFEALGVPALGVDDAHVRGERRLLRRFLVHDLTEPLPFLGLFDLCLCLEVAEHLPPSASDVLVGSLSSVADRILFSAAVPGQGGTGHLNEQPHSYWIERFDRAGFDADPAWRDQFTRDEDIAWWYRQNMILLQRRERRPDHWPYLPELPSGPPAPAPTPRRPVAETVAPGAERRADVRSMVRRAARLLAAGRRRHADLTARLDVIAETSAALAGDVDALRRHVGDGDGTAIGMRLRRLEYLVEQLHGPLLVEQERRRAGSTLDAADRRA